MSLKEFFTPTKEKIILFIVLVVLTFATKTLSDTYPGWCRNGETGDNYCERPMIGTVSELIYTILYLPSTSIKTIGLSLLTYEGQTKTFEFLSFWKIPLLIIGGIWIYFLSCLLILIYEKFKSKN